MLLTVFRHGEAADAASDYARMLTTTGEQAVALAAGALRQACQARDMPVPDALCCSPWIRTMATADILSNTLGMPLAEVEPALQPGASPAGVEQFLAARIAASSVPAHLLMVSHQPLVSRLVDRWSDTAGRVPPLNPAAFATLEMAVPARGGGRLLFWALAPLFEISA